MKKYSAAIGGNTNENFSFHNESQIDRADVSFAIMRHRRIFEYLIWSVVDRDSELFLWQFYWQSSFDRFLRNFQF